MRYNREVCDRCLKYMVNDPDDNSHIVGVNDYLKVVNRGQIAHIVWSYDTAFVFVYEDGERQMAGKCKDECKYMLEHLALVDQIEWQI